MEGLAAQAGMQQQMELEQVVNMLMQGVPPEELVQQGVPVGLVEQAIQMIMAQEQQAQVQSAPPSTQAGLVMTAGM
jgi:hypothetical protein